MSKHSKRNENRAAKRKRKSVGSKMRKARKAAATKVQG